jgi:uncharacterized membrane protein
MRHVSTIVENNRPQFGQYILEAVAAGALLAYATGQNRRGPRSVAARLTASALLLAAFAPGLRRQLLRIGAARRRVHLRTTIEIDRPVHEVFEFCRDFENFPRVVQSLRRVTDFQDGRSCWEVIAPSGEVLSWNSQVTKYVPIVVIAWRSVPGSVVDCVGVIRFSPAARGGTRLRIEVDYDPCHTGISDALRALFDVPRTEQLEADLGRANFYLSGQPRRAVDLDAEAEESTSTRSVSTPQTTPESADASAGN